MMRAKVSPVGEKLAKELGRCKMFHVEHGAARLVWKFELLLDRESGPVRSVPRGTLMPVVPRGTIPSQRSMTARSRSCVRPREISEAIEEWQSAPATATHAPSEL